MVQTSLRREGRCRRRRAIAAGGIGMQKSGKMVRDEPCQLPCIGRRGALQCLAVLQCCGSRGRDDDEAAVWWDGQAVLRRESLD